jgi:hypothetical protein
MWVIVSREAIVIVRIFIRISAIVRFYISAITSKISVDEYISCKSKTNYEKKTNDS